MRGQDDARHARERAEAEGWAAGALRRGASNAGIYPEVGGVVQVPGWIKVREGAGVSIDIRQGACREVLATLPARSVHCVITSPPYFGLRNYNGGAQEIGAERTPAEYVAHLVEVFRAVHRVLRDDGTCWVVIGDSYAGSWVNYAPHGIKGQQRSRMEEGRRWERPAYGDTTHKPATADGTGVPAKNLLMIPHRVALALQADGWYVRNDCVWAKGSAMPESVQDRFSRAHEYVFHLAKSERYYFDPVAVAAPCVKGAAGSLFTHGKTAVNGLGRVSQAERVEHGTRNRRSVLHINPQPFSAADFGVKDIDHYAVFPEKLVEILTLCATSEAGCCPRCAAPWRRVVERTPMVIARSGRCEAMGEQGRTQPSGTMVSPARSTTTGWQAGCACEAGPPLPCTTLDPFLGSGTVALVSKRLGRSCVGIELNPAYCDLAQRRIDSVPFTLFSAASTSTGAAR